LVGVGWSVGGLSQITRCRRTRAQNGDDVAVTFSGQDPFCLDGQQLISVAGKYGADGTEYRTQHDSFTKIVSHGDCQPEASDCLGPTSFTAYLKNGMIRSYGSSPSAAEGAASIATRIEGQRISRNVPDETQPIAVTDTSQTVRYAWALSRSEDRFGNGVNYYYTLFQTLSSNNEPTYEFVPDAIRYTDHNSWPALKSIRFLYESRPDTAAYYVSGLRMILLRRLVRLEMNGPEPILPTTVRKYKLGYQNNSVTQRSLVASITECDGKDVCKAPLTFDWELGSTTFRDIDTGIHHVTPAMSGIGEGGTPPPISKVGALTSWMSSTSTTDHVQHIAYIRGDGNPTHDGTPHELYLHLGQQPWAWHYMAVNRAADRSALTSWTSSPRNVHVAYVADDRHVYVQSKYGRQPWLDEDATAASGAPRAQSSALTSWFNSVDNLQHIAFIGDDKHVYEIYAQPGDKAWNFDDATLAARAPLSAQGGALTSWFSQRDGKQHIAYIGEDGHVYDLLKFPGQAPWAYLDATGPKHAPTAQTGALTSWVSTADNIQHIALRGAFQGY
jgi:hypothetical protein